MGTLGGPSIKHNKLKSFSHWNGECGPIFFVFFSDNDEKSHGYKIIPNKYANRNHFFHFVFKVGDQFLMNTNRGKITFI